MKRAVKVAELMHLLSQIRHTYSELLLCSCMSIAKLFFGLIMCQLNHMEKASI